MAEPKAGEKIGFYEIRSVLGKGGMGTVYLADDHSLDRRVALKMLPLRLSQDPDIVARFQREARALAKLRHPNLMHIYTVGEHQGRPFFAMEYIKGSTLGAVIAKTGRLRPPQAVHIAAEVMSALDKVHKAGTIHRDIKPGNIMIDEDGRAVLMDFGLARQETDAALTADHTVLGTPSYMSPEQAGGERLDARTDIYSLGVVMYEMLTGSPPFKGKTSFEVLRQHIESTVPAPSELQPGVPPELDVAIARALAKSPGDRFQDVGEMAAALSQVYRNATLIRLVRVAQGDTAPTVLTAPPGPNFASTISLSETVLSRRARRGPGPRRLLRAGAVAALVVLAALLAWLAFRPSPGPAPTPTPEHRVELRLRSGASVRGRLMEIKHLDDGTTKVKIMADGSGQPRTIIIGEGDVLDVVRDRD